ncbi:MAG: hypothetical protein Q9183_006463, partial [Haloplaca sp. 2 TL-2023]
TVEFSVRLGILTGVYVVDGALLEEAEALEVTLNGVDAAVDFSAFVKDGVGVSTASAGVAVHGGHFYIVAAHWKLLGKQQ